MSLSRITRALAGIGLLGVGAPSCGSPDGTSTGNGGDPSAERYELVCSTYLGGGGYEEGREILGLPDGSMMIGGQTYSTGMPVPGGFLTSYRGEAAQANGPSDGQLGGDSYLATVSADCGAVLAGTYVGGSRQERAVYGMEQAGDGIVVSGVTRSLDFPTTAGAFQRTYGGGTADSWLLKVPPTLSSPLWATYVGGPDEEWTRAGVSVAADGSIWTAGSIKNAAGGIDGLVMRMTGDGRANPLRATIGGTGEDDLVGLLVLPNGDLFVDGHTQSTDFPSTTGPAPAGGWDTFFARLDGAGRTVWARLDGTTGNEFGEHRPVLCQGLVIVPTTRGIVVVDPTTGAIHARIATPGAAIAPSCGPDGRIYVGGVSDGPTLTTTPGALQAKFQGGATDGWFMVARTDGTVDYATYLGGEGDDMVRGADVTDSGLILLVGRTNSGRFPVGATSFQRTHRGNSDMFVTVLRRVPGASSP